MQISWRKGLMLSIMAASLVLTEQAEEARAEQAALIAELSQWLSAPVTAGAEADATSPTLAAFYAGRQNAPAWVDENGLNARGAAMVAVLARAGAEGLNPARYHVATLSQTDPTPGETPAHHLLSLELTLSNAVLAYAADMQAGSVRPQWNMGATSLTAEEKLGLLASLATQSNPAKILEDFSPKTKDYAAVKQYLAQYQALARSGGWPAFEPGKTLKPGMADPRLPTLQALLTITGDLTEATSASTYDPALQAAVQRFQARHAIEPDGVLGKATQEALAIPVDSRIRQMALTLERMRWMPRDLGSRYVLVNVPGYRLRAVASGQELAMNVVVGKSATPTPMFSKQITSLIVNPSWGVPSKIAVKEMLPKVKKDPSYLVRAGYQVTQDGVAVDPSSIDWSSVGAHGFNYSFRQKPGDDNALGKVKFSIPDSDDIYLHDTSQRKFFARAERSLSHGCVRLGEPEALTRLVLKAEGWSDAKIDAAYDANATRSIAITPTPVHLVYWTSWVDESGALHFNRDIYGHDQRLLATMERTAPALGTGVKLAMNR